MANNQQKEQPTIPEHDIKQNSGVSATMALQAAQKAWELRQAAKGAANAKAREQALAKAINKEIEAESFGKAAKYTRSGAFQGLAAGAGLGVQPGVTLGKVTGAIVGGTVSTVTGLLGGGIGSVWGAMNGPFWDLGEMAASGVEGVVGDWLPDWAATNSQKKALEKMVMQTKDTQAPTKEDLEAMKNDAPDDMPQSWSQSMNDMTSWRPSMPSMPNMPSASQGGAALGLGGLSSSLWGGGKKEEPRPRESRAGQKGQRPSQAQTQAPRSSSTHPSKEQDHNVQQAPKPTVTPIGKVAPEPVKIPTDHTRSASSSTPKEDSTPAATNRGKGAPATKNNSASKQTANPSDAFKAKDPTPKEATKPTPSQPRKEPSSNQKNDPSSGENIDNKAAGIAESTKRKPRKLSIKNKDPQTGQEGSQKRAPRKLETRKPAV